MRCKILAVLCCLLCGSFHLIEAEGIRVRYSQKLSHAFAGDETALQIFVQNEKNYPVTLVGHLGLPPHWKALPTNDIFFHLMPHQSLIQTIILKTPDYEAPGEFLVFYEVHSFDNAHIYDVDTTLMLLRNPNRAPFKLHRSDVKNGNVEVAKAQEFESRELSLEPQSNSSAYLGIPKEVPNLIKQQNLKAKEKNQSQIQQPDRVSLKITSDTQLIAKENEMLFVTCLINNETQKLLQDTLSLSCPEEWVVISGKEVDVKIAPGETFFHVFGVKIPSYAHANQYHLHGHLKHQGLISECIQINILPKIDLDVKIKELAACYSLNQPIDLELICRNKGNCSIKFLIELTTDPVCKTLYRGSDIDLLAQENYIANVHLQPALGMHDDKQFVFLKVFDSETNTLLYQNTYTLAFANSLEEDEDSYIRIPSEMTLFTLGDNQNIVSGIEWSGRGMIDPLSKQSIDFIFRLPNKHRNVIYEIDQILYLRFQQPGWDIVFGDSVYSLTSLTQRHRYGRGAGFDVEKQNIAFGAYTTQNTFDNNYNPKESGGYFGWMPNRKTYLSINYFQKEFPVHVQKKNDAKIVSLSSEIDLKGDVHVDLEVARNLLKYDENKKDKHQKKTNAFRFHTDGKMFQDGWFDFEKIYAGAAFNGYYNHLDFLSGTIDLPLYSCMRTNCSATHINEVSVCEDHQIVKLNQKQYNANLSYHYLNGSSVTFNGMLLNACGIDRSHPFHFFQQWAGLTAFIPFKGWSLLGLFSLGREEDHITKSKNTLTQKYYFTMNKQMTERFSGTLFYDAGNTNYYDAKSWSTTLGGSIRCHYQANAFAEIFLQKVNNKKDHYQFNQVSFKLIHTTAQRHVLDVSIQNFCYKKHYNNDFLFLVSYTIPFGLPVARRKDIGDVSGYVRHRESGLPIQETLVSIGDKQCLTNSQGKFLFKNVKSGQHHIRIDLLPQEMIAAQSESKAMTVKGAQNNPIVMDVTHNGSLSGDIMQILTQDPIEWMRGVTADSQRKPIKSIEIMINRNNGEEIYSTYSDEQGMFNFSKLRPGQWVISVAVDELPLLHHMDQNNLVIDLKPGDQEKIHFQVVPVRRAIKPLIPK